jgi:hypothetical protein
MSLIGTARALDDDRFLWRVRAAALNAAVSKYSSTDANDKGFAQEILDSPMKQNATLEALVANNAAVSAAVVIDEANTVNTEGVTDTQITNAVTMYWPAVAARRAEIRAKAALAQTP